MHILFAAIPAYGHLYPLMPLALAAAEAGHQVTMASGPPFQGRLPLPTVTALPHQVDERWAAAEALRRHPEAQGLELAATMFGEVAAEQTIATLLPHLQADRPDLVVFEALNVGAGVAADALGIPSLTFGISLTDANVAVFHARALAVHSNVWARHGRTPPHGPLVGRGLLNPTPPSLWRPTVDVPTWPIRSVAYAESVGALPRWLLDPPTRPRIYLTLGTVAFGAVPALRRAVAAAAAYEVDVLVAVGADGDPSALGDVGPRVRVERFVSQAEVLPRVDLAIHHGGTGTVLGCLAAGVPQILMPQGADQFINADVLRDAGAALAVPNEASEAVLFDAVGALLQPDAAELGVTAALAAEIADLPEPAAVLRDLEAVAAA